MFLYLFLFGDVRVESEHRPRRAVVVSNKGRGRIDNPFSSIFGAVLDLPMEFPGRNQLFEQRPAVVSRGENQLFQPPPDRFIRAPAVETLSTPVPNRDEVTGEIADNNRVLCALDNISLF